MSEVCRRYEAQRLLRSGRALLRHGEFDWSKSRARDLLWEAQDGRCLRCNTRLHSRYRHPNDGDRDTIDHVDPKARFGLDALGNIALMHHKCNAAKGSRAPTEAERVGLAAINAKLGWPNRT